MTTTLTVDKFYGQMYDNGGASVNVRHPDFGAVGNGTADDTAAIQAYFNALTANTNLSLNPSATIPAGRYKLTATVNIPNNVAYFAVMGAGSRSTVFEWGGAAGQPMFKATNCRGPRFVGCGFIYGTAKPSYGLQFDRTTAGSGAAPMYAKVESCWFGGDMSAAMGMGVGFTASGGYDANNEQSVVRDCEFYNCDTGIHYGHSNSLWHKADNNHFEGCNVGISNYVASGYGGGFNAHGCKFTLCVYPFQIGKSRYPIRMVDCNGESNTWLLHTPEQITSGYGGVEVCGGLWYVETSAGLLWNSSVGASLARLVLRNITVLGSSGAKMDFPGTDPVFIEGGSINFPGADSLKYNGPTYLRGVGQSIDLRTVGTPYSSTGSLFVENTGTNLNPLFLTEEATPYVRGIPQDAVLVANFSAPTSVADLYYRFEGQRLTIVATNGNCTIQNGAGILLAGGVNFAMSSGATLSLVCTGGLWYETGRKA